MPTLWELAAVAQQQLVVQGTNRRWDGAPQWGQRCRDLGERGSWYSTAVVTRSHLCSASAGAMLPYRTESPVLPGRCQVRTGRVVPGPQFAYCPSPQGKCLQPSSSSSSSLPGSALLLARPWPRQCWALLCRDRAVM